MASSTDRGGQQYHLSTISTSYLAELARIATGDADIAVSTWDRKPIHGGFGGAIGGTALYRFTLAIAEGRTITLILKVLYQRQNETEQSPYYWKREYEICRSGLLDDLPDGSFILPRIYRVESYRDACWIWMEDIADEKGDWSLEDFADIAERLGRFNGSWLTETALPDANWLSSNWHSAIVPALTNTFDQLDQLLENPLARITLPLDAKAEIEAIWRDREIFRRALAELPRTFCHFDAFRRNVLYRDDEVFMIDWALAGIGGVGEDLVSMVAVSLYYEGFTQAYANELDEMVFASYVQGLRDAGWRGDQRLARIGYTCGMTLRGLAGVKQDIGFLADPSHYERLKKDHHSDNLEDIARFFAEVRRFRLLKMAREARSLLSG